MTPATPLVHALLYLKNAKIRIKYPNFAVFALESASPRTPNTPVTPTKIFLNVKLQLILASGGNNPCFFDF